MHHCIVAPRFCHHIGDSAVNRARPWQLGRDSSAATLLTSHIPTIELDCMKLPPSAVVSVGVLFVSFSAIFIRLTDAPPLIIAAYRMAFAAIIMSPLYVRERLRSVNTGATKRAVGLSLLSGLFLALHFSTWVTSLRYTSVASSTVIVTTNPMIVGLLALFILHEKIRPRAAAFMVAGFGGSVLLMVGGFSVGGSAPLGDFLAFVGALMVSGYMLIGRVVRQSMSLHQYTFIVYSSSALLLILFAVVAGNRFFPYSLKDFGLFLGLAIFCTLLGHSLFNWALRYLKPTVVATSILGEPVIATVLAFFIFGEVPTVTTIVGGLVILASIYLFMREETRTASDAAKNRM